MIILAIVLPFSSPLLPGVIVIVSTLFFLHVILSQPDFSFKNISAKKLLRTFQNLPRFIVFILLLISALSLYSLYIGSFNSSNGLETISLTERYLKLPRGLFRIFTQKPGWLMVLGVTVLNSVILWYIKSIYGRKKILISLKWIFIFSLLYVLLLPMGGFREYRSNIIRYDTFLPITLCFIYYFGVSTIVVLRHKTLRFQKIYIVCITFILVAFTSADKIKGEGNTCEKWALGVIAASKTEPVLLNTDCTILSWHIISDFRESEGNAAVLKIWGITKKPMRYFQKNDLANSKFK